MTMPWSETSLIFQAIEPGDDDSSKLLILSLIQFYCFGKAAEGGLASGELQSLCVWLASGNIILLSSPETEPLLGIIPFYR